MNTLWGNLIQALSALFLYDPMETFLVVQKLQDSAADEYSKNPEVYLYEPRAIEPLLYCTNELYVAIIQSLLKLSTLDAVAKIQPIKIKIR
jgi:hypothetical protein